MSAATISPPRSCRALIERTGIDPAEIEDVVLGNTQQQREQGFNIARIVGLMSGLPSTAAGATINRLCGSSLQAINQAAHSIIAGGEDVQIVGGLEHMQHIPMDAGVDFNPKLFHGTSKGALHMGFTAEFLAQTQGISREAQDEFALASHQKAAAATETTASSPARSSPSGATTKQALPLEVTDRSVHSPRHEPGSTRRA